MREILGAILNERPLLFILLKLFFDLAERSKDVSKEIPFYHRSSIFHKAIKCFPRLFLITFPFYSELKFSLFAFVLANPMTSDAFYSVPAVLEMLLLLL